MPQLTAMRPAVLAEPAATPTPTGVALVGRAAMETVTSRALAVSGDEAVHRRRATAVRVASEELGKASGLRSAALVALAVLRQQAPAMAATEAMAAPQVVPVALGAQASAGLPEQRALRKVPDS